MCACKRGKTKYVQGILYFSSVSRTLYIPQFPSYGDQALKTSLRLFGLQINPACVACLAVCAKHKLEK